MEEKIKLLIKNLRAEVRSEVDSRYGFKNKRQTQILELIEAYEELDKRHLVVLNKLGGVSGE